MISVEHAVSRALGVDVVLEHGVDRDAVLRRSMVRAGLDVDPRSVRFPHRRVSLTHTGGDVVVAALFEDAPGIGVDVERDRPVPRDAARLLLHASEQRRAREDDATLLRLWTAKEALYKADPDNDGGWVGRWVLDDPRAVTSLATGPTRRRFRVHSRRVDGGWLSVAVALAEVLA